MNLLTNRETIKVSTSREQPTVCETRGHCGPFANQMFYDSFPDEMWRGMGDCRVCGTTRKVN